MKTIALTQLRDQLSTAYAGAIDRLVDDGHSVKEIGLSIGYPGGNMVSLVRAGSCLFGPVQGLAFARYCSEAGIEEVSRIYHAPAPMPQEVNHSILDELQEIVEEFGDISTGYRTLNVAFARRRLRDAQETIDRASRELDLIEREQAATRSQLRLVA